MYPTSGDIAMQNPNSGNLLLRNVVVVASSLSSQKMYDCNSWRKRR